LSIGQNSIGFMTMIAAIFFGLVLISCCTFVHYEVLRLLGEALPRIQVIPRRLKVLVVVLSAIGSHCIQIMVFGFAFFLLRDRFGLGSFGGTFSDDLPTFMYFSAETYTSLGFGDIYPLGELRAVVGIEALTGLVMIGWTASFTYLEMVRFWVDHEDDR
jgi:hypothetical protein